MSVKEINLSKPILVNGKEIDVLTYDIDELSIEDVTKAEELKRKLGGTVSTSMVHADFPFHICLGIKAVTAINKDIAEEDLMRIKGHDIAKIGVAGMGFFMPSEKKSQGKSSEKQQEDMQDNITAQ